MTVPAVQPQHDLVDLVHELTQTTTQIEHYTVRIADGWDGRNHHTTSPPLIRQLYDAAAEITAPNDNGRLPGYLSKPAGRLEAIDTAIRIDLAAARWVRDLGEDDPADQLDPLTGLPDHGTGTIACIRKLHALTASALPITRRAIEADVRRWWTWARIATGWDTPAWAPDATCPSCSQRGGLRIRLDQHLGTCRECEATWDPATIGVLADHVRAESEARRLATIAAWCWCTWPRLDPTKLTLCRWCGSSRCWRAGA